MRILIVVAMAVAACAGDPAPNDGCTGAAYDPCSTEHDCDTPFCQNFAVEGFQVCTTSCDGTTACPTGGDCDLTVGMCKPAAANTCTLAPG
ncbi:MAG: hypothetical protein H6Q90_2933 [Deltaproteobacteria bacterium]|nr:hypothetical protein [Deltaproteobacteria bacterium]